MKQEKQKEEVVVEVKQEQQKEGAITMKKENKTEQEKVQVKEDEKQEQKQKNDKGKTGKKVSSLLPNYIESLNFPELVDVTLDLDGKVIYLVKKQKKLSIARQWITKNGILIPPPKNCLPYELVDVRDVLYHYHSKMHDDLFDRVSNYFHKASYLEDEKHLIVSLYVFLTYLQNHKDINHLPEIMFFAVPERGKSRTVKAMTYISFRGIHLVSVLPASIFRFSQNHQATLFFDVMDFWTKVIKNQAEDIFLGRFEKGSKVSRVIYLDRGAFRDTVIYKVFGPTGIATNQAIGHILGTRCIEIQTPYMLGKYTNYKAKDDVVLDLKAQLTAWKAKVMDQPLPLVEEIEGIDGRLWDISKPLLSICKLVCPEKYDILIGALLKQAKGRAEDKKESVEGTIIKIIYNLSNDSVGNWIMTSAILARLNDDLPEIRKYTSQWLGRKLKSLGVETDRLPGRSRMAIDQPILEKLYDQYGCKISNDVDTDDRENSENSDNTEKLIRLVQ